jgi:hypothetical protein
MRMCRLALLLLVAALPAVAVAARAARGSAVAARRGCVPAVCGLVPGAAHPAKLWRGSGRCSYRCPGAY